MKDANRHSKSIEEQYPLDPEMVLVTLYLHNQLPPALWEKVDARLKNDLEFFGRAWPLINAFEEVSPSPSSAIPEVEPPLSAADEARVRRSLERFYVSIGRTPEGEIIAPDEGLTTQGTPIVAPEAASPPPGARPVTLVPRVTPAHRPWRDRLPTFVWRRRTSLTAAVACAIALIAALIRFGAPISSVPQVAHVTPLSPTHPAVAVTPVTPVPTAPRVPVAKPVVAIKPEATTVTPTTPTTRLITPTPITQGADDKPSIDENLVDFVVDLLVPEPEYIPRPLSQPAGPTLQPVFVRMYYPPLPERRVYPLPWGVAMTLEAGSAAEVTQPNVPTKVLFVELRGAAGFDVPDTGNVAVNVRTVPAQITLYRGGRFAVRTAADSSELLVSIATGITRARSLDAPPAEALMITAGQFARIPRKGNAELTTGEGYPVPPKPAKPAPPPVLPEDRR